MNLYNLNIVRITFIFLNANEIQTIEPEIKNIDHARNQIIKIVEDIQQTTDFPPTFNKYCVDCRFLCEKRLEIKSQLSPK